MFALKNFKNFKGKIDQLVDQLDICMNELGIKKDKLNISRTVRYYINEKVLPPAERDGRDFTYHYEHIIKFLYLRKQLNDGWPLNKIKENTQYQDLSYFEEYFESVDKDDAFDSSMKVISDIKETTYSKSESSVRETNRPKPDRFNPYVAQEQTGIPNLKDALREINSDIGNVVKQDFTTLQLSLSLVLLIEKNLMSTMNYDLAKKIGNAISAALFHKNPITINELQQIYTTHQNSINHLDEIQKLRAEIEKIKISNEVTIRNLENQKEVELENLKLEIHKLKSENEFNCPKCNEKIRK